MNVEVYPMGDEVGIAISLGDGATRILSRTEALELAQKLLLTLEEHAVKPGEKMWLLIAGSNFRPIPLLLKRFQFEERSDKDGRRY